MLAGTSAQILRNTQTVPVRTSFFAGEAALAAVIDCKASNTVTAARAAARLMIFGEAT
jgi:hypothetical protein